MRTAVKAITSCIGLLAAIAAHGQTRVIDQQWQFSTDPKAQFTPTTVGRAATWRPAQPSLSWNAQYADLRDYAGVGWYRVNVVLPALSPLHGNSSILGLSITLRASGSMAGCWASMREATLPSLSI